MRKLLLFILAFNTLTSTLKAQVGASVVMLSPQDYAVLQGQLKAQMQIASAQKKTWMENNKIYGETVKTLNTLKQMKQSYETMVQIQQDAYATINDIVDLTKLKWSDITNIVSQTLCIDVDPKNYLPNKPNSGISWLGFYQNQCPDYVTTYSTYRVFGITQKDYYDVNNYLSGRPSDIGNKPIGAVIEDFKLRERQAYVARNEATEAVNMNRLNLSNTYLRLSDSLSRASYELYTILNPKFGESQVKVTQGERLMLDYCATMYNVYALEFKEKGYELLYSASRMDKDKEDLNVKLRRSLELKQAIDAMKRKFTPVN